MVWEVLNLIKVFKGDNKIQGNWGEVVLVKVFEVLGLCEGYEY